MVLVVILMPLLIFLFNSPLESRLKSKNVQLGKALTRS